jgi:LCP family protein required for cell wall assembly
MSFEVRRVSPDRPQRVFPWKKIASVALSLRIPVRTWFAHWKTHREEQKKQERRENLLKRIALILFVILCSVVLLAGAVSALVKLQVLSLHNIASMAGAELPVDAYGHTNFLLLGTGDKSHEGVDLTDTIMIASIDVKGTKAVSLLSLPRDLYLLDTKNMGKGRINELYLGYKQRLKREEHLVDTSASQQALRELSNEIGRLLHIEIHRTVKVDFIGFVQAVDALGGVDINVPYDLVDPEYPGPNYTYETFALNAGMQHMDGETALKYARSRHSTSDFSRSGRQQQLISALGEKMKAEGILTRPDKVLSLLNIMSEHVDMTLSSAELLGLAALGKEIDRTKTTSVQINDQNGLYSTLPSPGGFLYAPPRDQFGGASVLLPVSIPPDPITWAQIQAFTSLYINSRVP